MADLGGAVSGIPHSSAAPAGAVDLAEPENANLLAVILHNLLSKSTAFPSGSYCLRSGAMAARVFFGGKTRIESGDGPADCTMEGSLDTFIRLALGKEGPVRAWLGRRVSFQGNPFKALGFLEAIRCRS